MRKTLVILAIVLIQGISGHLFAQGGYGFEIGAFGGRSLWQDRDFQIGPPHVPVGSPPINLNFAYNDEFVYGGRFNLMSRGHWGGEISYSYQKNTVTLSRQNFRNVELDGGVHHFFYNMIFNLTSYEKAKLVPFVTGGVGLAGYALSDEARAKAADPTVYGIGNLRPYEKRFAYNYGFGVKAKVTSSVGVRADFRHIFSDVPSYGLPKESSNPTQTVLPIQGKLQMYEVSAGIYFHFSKGF